ncbi:hypothetical protein KDK95_22910 [Actinospica sp. MGRD01-02]|uniref:NTF2-like N-terminal transpeptidase domain-containing protein n=1 Tax=Actinospica acidithermotolerans TaxID=2828514 RepID=A0A941EET9_9ACTN|nr:NTF2-like N-terminal transpeptidase domain-containing protein [Actinospica acidithermotolerans]MBR7829177.1 hypothetical protein [Actinospica acidithermotolerans]
MSFENPGNGPEGWNNAQRPGPPSGYGQQPPQPPQQPAEGYAQQPQAQPPRQPADGQAWQAQAPQQPQQSQPQQPAGYAQQVPQQPQAPQQSGEAYGQPQQPVPAPGIGPGAPTEQFGAPPSAAAPTEQIGALPAAAPGAPAPNPGPFASNGGGFTPSNGGGFTSSNGGGFTPSNGGGFTSSNGGGFGASNGGPFTPSPGPFTPSGGEPFGAAEQSGRRPPRTKVAVATGIGVVGIIGLATVLIMSQNSSAAPGGNTAGGSSHSASASPTPSGFQPTATAPAAAAAQTAAVFLNAWQSGNFKLAASYTDDSAAAQSALSSYTSGLNLGGLKIKPGASTAAGTVSFSVAADVASGGSSTSKASYASGTWTYTSQLTAYKKDGGWWIKWDPSLVVPGMTATTHPVAVAVKPGAAKVTDSSGADLSASTQTALQNISATIKENTKSTQGTAGLEIALEDSSGNVVSGSKQVLSKAVSTATVKTTIDPTVEALAISAVGELPRSSMVVIRPSTGAILAVANSAGLSDVALTGTLAPGSSFKVVSTTGLLVDGLLPQGIDTKVGCPLVETVQGVKIHNSTTSANSSAGTEDFEPNTTPFSTDFAQSCNNAFTQWWQQMAGGKLANAATTYYGLNEEWDIGLGGKGSYFSMPSHQSGSELAEELYGQGEIEANPLTMASVAATVDTGTFHQPYLVPGLTDMATATSLPSSVKSQLWSVMREVITSGTASAVGFGSGVYGKTGTAEADANKDNYPNGWMIVFDPSKDLAIAAEVTDSNFGAKTAGPEVNYVLQHS